MQILLLIDKLKSLDNERAIVARLVNAEHAATKDVPNEMLLNIFSFLCPPMAVSKINSRTGNSRSLDTKDHPTADLRRVSQVCYSWRNLALASPSLWSTSLDFNDEAFPWLKELLRRCESFPIHITADFSSIHVLHPFGEAIKARGMIAKLEMTSESSPNIGSISVVYDKSFPLSIIIEDFISNRCTSATRLSFSTSLLHIQGSQTNGNLLPKLCNDHLRQLEVNGYHPDLTLSCFRHLGSLSVSHLSGITANEWGRALAGLPELTHLRLEDAVSSNSGFRVESIKFPCLKTLALIGEFDHGIGDFLLAIEATKKFSLLLHCTIGKNTNLDQLLQGLRKWFAIWNINLHPDVSHRRIDIMASHSRFRIHNQIPRMELSDEWFRVFLNWRRISDLYCLRKLQADILQVFGPILTQTRTLSICPDVFDQGFICSPGFWQHFHEVRVLRFFKAARDDMGLSTTGFFMSALCNDIERSTSTNPLPMLRVLSFENENILCHPHWMWSLERLFMLLANQIDVVELYACNGTSNLSRLHIYQVTRILTSTEMKSPRF